MQQGLRLHPELLRAVAVWLLGCSVLAIAHPVLDYDNYWPEEIGPQLKSAQLPAGRQTKLRCNVPDRLRHVRTGLNLTWEFKVCISGYTAACMKHGSWTPLCGAPCQLCSPVLTLVGPGAQDSGLYRCHITSHSTQTTLNVYLLHFTELRRGAPEIVGGMDADVSVVAPLAVVLRCEVRSPTVPTIRWFRRSPTPTAPPNIVRHLNHTYQLMPCCEVAALPQSGLYLSKLVLGPTSELDSGLYVCLAINEANYTHRQVSVSVTPGLPTHGESGRPRSFLGLFLIPAALALVPAAAWAMCIRYRALATPEAAGPPQPPTTQRQSNPPSRDIWQKNRELVSTCPPQEIGVK